jgi:Flp pilus assembly protein TadD
MRKIIPSTIMALVLAGTIVFLLSSCSYFKKQDHGFAKSRDFSRQVVFKKIETNPIEAESHYMMGCQFQKQKKHAWAIEEFQAAVQKNSAYVEAYNRMGVSYDLVGDFDQAMAAYEAALGIDSELDYVHNNMGYSYLLQKRFDLAVASFRKAVSLNAENKRYRNNLALAYAQSGEEEAAIAAVKTDGGEAEAHSRMAAVYYRGGEYEKAEAYYAKAARLKPKDPETKKGLAAAANLAAIYAYRSNSPQEQKPNDTEPQQVVLNRYEEDGFYTVPAMPVDDFDGAEIVVTLVEESAFKADTTVAESTEPTTHAATIPTSDSQVEDLRLEEEPFLLSSLQPLDETAVGAMLTKELENPEIQDPGRVLIEVSNGNGLRHMAKQVGHYLKGGAFVLMYLSNADHFNYDRTTIYYTGGHLAEAFELSQKLPGDQFMQQVAVIREGNADISILIGKDLVPHREALKSI